MKKLILLLLFIPLVFSCSNESSEDSTNEDTPFFLAPNGVTIKARDWVKPGTTSILNGIVYTAVDKEMLIKMNNERKDLSKVVTTLITDMSMLFYPPTDSNFDGVLNYYDSFNHAFNQNIRSWDLSNVTDMSFMFYSARDFNQDIGLWDVSNVKNMDGLFVFTEFFNQDLTNWCVEKIKLEPLDFSTLSPLAKTNKPKWGESCN